MVISQGEVWWADLRWPLGSEPGFRRAVVVVQGDALNRSRIATVVCVPLTSNLKWADAPGNVLLAARSTSLPKDSVANVSQIVALDKTALKERVSKLSAARIQLLLTGSPAQAFLGIRRHGSCRFELCAVRDFRKTLPTRCLATGRPTTFVYLGCQI